MKAPNMFMKPVAEKENRGDGEMTNDQMTNDQMINVFRVL